jgi:Transposase DDE domain
LAADSDFWFDNVWIADSTPVECGRSRPTVKRSELAGWANTGYSASHSRWFWGLRLYLICTPGMPILWALADPKIGEREVLTAMLDVEPRLALARPGLTLITDKGFAGRLTETGLAASGITLLRPARKDEAARQGEPLLKIGPPADRIGQRHPQGPTRPRSARRTHLRMRRHPHRPAHPGHGRRHLAQQQDRRPGPPLADRLRPLTWRKESLV